MAHTWRLRAVACIKSGLVERTSTFFSTQSVSATRLTSKVCWGIWASWAARSACNTAGSARRASTVLASTYFFLKPTRQQAKRAHPVSINFNDSINDNLDLIKQLLGNLTPGQKQRAKRVAVKIEEVVSKIQKDHEGDPAGGLGLVFAVMYIAQNMVQNNSVGEDGPRIPLLS